MRWSPTQCLRGFHKSARPEVGTVPHRARPGPSVGSLTMPSLFPFVGSLPAPYSDFVHRNGLQPQPLTCAQSILQAKEPAAALQGPPALSSYTTKRISKVYRVQSVPFHPRGIHTHRSHSIELMHSSSPRLTPCLSFSYESPMSLTLIQSSLMTLKIV